MFDLDGTLVQTRGASWAVFRQISDEFGLGLTGPQEYFDLFRGNIFASLDSLCDGHADSEQVKQAFLERLRAQYNPAMVPGMADVIRRLAGHCTLAVVSSNAMEVLRRVLVGNGVAYCFAHVFGGDAVPDKTAAFRSFLADAASQYGRRCEVTYDETPGATRPDLSTTVLVTDTAGDVRDALGAGIRAVGVAWGMHTADELTAAGAEFVAIWPQELPGYLLTGTVPEPTGACAIPPPPTATAPPRAGVTAPPPNAARGSCGAKADECACGCSTVDARPPVTSVAARQAAAAATRRDRRQQAAQLLRSPGATAPPPPSAAPASSSGSAAAAPARRPGSSAPATELRDAVARILGPVASR
jgi:phosphoglycolate phosphatase